MSFTGGFSKISAFGHNNQGLEFKEFDTEPPAAANPGGMAPSGIEFYQPINNKNDPTKPLQQYKKDKAPKAALAKLVVEKLSEARIDSYSASGAGSSSDAASTIATQLKYDQSTPWGHEGIGPSFKDLEKAVQKTKRGRRI